MSWTKAMRRSTQVAELSTCGLEVLDILPKGRTFALCDECEQVVRSYGGGQNFPSFRRDVMTGPHVGDTIVLFCDVPAGSRIGVARKASRQAPGTLLYQRFDAPISIVKLSMYSSLSPNRLAPYG